VDITWGSMVRRAAPAQPQQLVPGVKNIIAVASGKGGVGKSTVSTNLAVALALDGASVGLLDADITGPNIPLMMGIEGAPTASAQGRIMPLEHYGVKVISIQFFVPQGQPIVWRGPLVGGAIQQFLRDVEWGDLDYLVIDLPPGTSDAQLTLAPHTMTGWCGMAQVAGAYELEGLASIPALRRILEVVAVDTLSLDNGIARSRVLIALVGVAAKLLEVGELEERITALEVSAAGREAPAPIFPAGEPVHLEVVS